MTLLDSQKPKISRRQFVVMAGALGAASTLPSGASAFARPLHLVNWAGSALGAKASIQLYHPDPSWAELQLARCQREIDRLESLFSLYRPQSATCRLNRDGYLDNPDIEFLSLLSRAIAFYHQTDGLFDVTVQPLWELYAHHYSSSSSDPKGPTKESINATLARVGSDQIQLAPSRISFHKKKMGLTFNGIAQGYITDRITALLKSAGFENILVSLGESSALGLKPDGQFWRAGIISPIDGRTIVKTVDLKDKAIATSGGYGSPFSAKSETNHILNPLTGKSTAPNRSVSVIAKTAVKADMASTAFLLMPIEKQEKLLKQHSDIEDVFYL
ncbi:MAG: FAD:protein FMN transferase [Sneathiella sp.]|uniref:FAD:protein FMN transferase n=1 Tax=Sneathiella sp. TaxID=1964365 RepID=UPI003001916B